MIRKSSNGATSISWVEIWDEADFDVLTGGEPQKNETAASFMDSLYQDGILFHISDPFEDIDPWIFEWEGNQVIDPRVKQYLDSMAITPRAKFEIDWDNLAKTPELIQYQENGYSWSAPAGPPPGFQRQAYELAKFVVPSSQIGIVRSIETGLTLVDSTGGDERRWPRGDALWHTRFGVFVRWHLRIEQYDHTKPFNPNNYRGPITWSDIPGTPYVPLPKWEEMRFMYGESHPVFFVIPENCYLSLWIEFRNSSYIPEVRNVSGRFQGMTQVQGSDRAFRNLTTGW